MSEPAGATSPPGRAAHPGRLLAALASEVRLRVFAAVVLTGPASTDEVVAAAATGRGETGRALARLASAGALVCDDGRWSAPVDALDASARLASRLRATPDPGQMATSPQQAAVLRAYLHNGRLRAIPAQRQKRLAVLDWLSQQFEPGKVYSEAEVNVMLDRYHPDAAALRRYLVDEEFMDRRQGSYWRAGGTFDVE